MKLLVRAAIAALFAVGLAVPVGASQAAQKPGYQRHAAASLAPVPIIGYAGATYTRTRTGTRVYTYFYDTTLDPTVTVRLVQRTGGVSTSSTMTIPNVTLEQVYQIPRGLYWSLKVYQKVGGRWYEVGAFSVSAKGV